MKFTINAKELKTMIDKVMTVVNKKGSFDALKRLYFTVGGNGNLSVFATDLEHYLEVRTDSVHQTETGSFVLDIDDMKVLTRMSGEIEMEDVDDCHIKVRNDKKSVTIPKFTNDADVVFPVFDAEKLLVVKENWLLETITDLQSFVYDSDDRPILSTYHFNVKQNRVEALDGHKVGIRTLKSQKAFNTEQNIKLHQMCYPVLKKVLDKKSESEITFSQNDKYVKVKGKDFTYITRQVNGEYMNVDKVIPTDVNCTLVVDRENILDVMKYDVEMTKGLDLKKNEYTPVILYSKNGTLYAYEMTKKYVMCDEIATTENTMKDEFYMGFNPKYLVDTFSVVDTDTPLCEIKNELSPLVVTGNEYKFIVLPVRLEDKHKNMVREYMKTY